MSTGNAQAEAALKRLRKLEQNCVCPNCGTHNQFGFGNVCVKFKTFVCDNCKSSHQAISHRCKSVTMSTWNMEEVQELTAQRGGGNLAACHACTLLPETSCEHMNLYLDRSMLVGTPEDPKLGFFSDLLDELAS